MKLDSLKKIYFIGIGGIGMSALARYFNQRGSIIEGYDKTETRLTKKLVSEGVKIHYTDDVKQIPKDIDLVVYTPAVPKEMRELAFLRMTDVPVMKRSEVLGVISKAKKCIAIAGTHGKTTTSSMTAHLLKNAGMDISCFIGGIANNFGSNYCFGESEWTVIEADEFDRSFHTLTPEIAVLISMDPDHLDIYGKKENMQASFEIFLRKVNSGGKIIMHEDLISSFDASFLNELRAKKIEIFQYGMHNNDFKVSNLRFEDGRQLFDMNGISDAELSMPGEHNTQNMGAAMAVAQLVSVEDDEIKTGVKTFSGIRRRFDITRGSGITYVDDYAHHPSELRAAIGSARKLWPESKLTVVFQPHLFSRTSDFMDDFAVELAKVDELLLMEIYPAREQPMEGITSSVLLEKIDLENKKVIKQADLIAALKKKEVEVLMTLGAGDIDVFAPQITEWITKK